MSTSKNPTHIDEKWNLSRQEDNNLDDQTKNNTGQQDENISNTASVHLDVAYEYCISKIRLTDMI